MEGAALLAVNGSAALRRAATASDADRSLWKAIIHGQLFPPVDFPAAEIQDMTPDSPRSEVRVTAMIDQLRPAPSDRPVDSPAPIKMEQITPLGPGRPPDPPESFGGLAQ
jgi:hypothetical protein